MKHIFGSWGSRESDAAFDRRLARWRRGKVELTGEEVDRFLAGCDPDIVLITKYLDAMLEPAEEAEVELRAETDDAFAYDLLLLAAAEGRVIAGLHDETLFGLYEVEDRARRRGLVLLFACVVVAAGAIASAASSRLRDLRTSARERAADRASTVDFREPQAVIAAKSDTSLTFQGGDVVVRRGSTLTYGAQVRTTDGAGVIALDGEAAFHSWAAASVVRTSRSVVHLLAGRFAVRHIPYSGETFITVDSGSAWIERPGSENDGSSHHRVLATVRAGERAIVRHGEVTIVPIADGFPSSAFAVPSGSFERDSSPALALYRQTYARVEQTLKLAHTIRR